ncbi:cytochrome d ubiquinol oxidase subunit II [Tepidibacillus infernus]|uniref:cytochrome d ubiquinol oxidase subunit II n=1 Tax=Tepidibacillus infernus TaxID=1806172 RepID=UPI003B68D8C5
MSLELLGITVLWIFLYGYMIIGSIDFGAGFFSYYGKLRKKDHLINGVINRYLSPVWEVTNVFLVFFFVGLVGFFPDTAYFYGTVLLIPASIATILLAIRGSFYAFANYGARDNQLFLFSYGVTGLLIPASLSTVLVISEGGFITELGDTISLNMSALLSSPLTWSVALLAVFSVLFISSAFLSYYANKAEDLEAREVLRKIALFSSVPMMISSFVMIFFLQRESAWHFNQLYGYAWAFLLGLLAFLTAIYLLYRKERFGIAFLMVMLQFAFAFFGYGASHLPYLLYPYLTIYDGIVNQTMGTYLVIGFIAGLTLLIPSLILLMRLFLFNVDYVKGNK